jgi:hypothetical protein
MGSARYIRRLNHGVTIFILVVGIKTNFTVMVLISVLPAVRTLVIGSVVICRVKDIILITSEGKVYQGLFRVGEYIGSFSAYRS